ncbi:winged helix-turn-helix domain-containing protein [Flindersiella endophytica]
MPAPIALSVAEARRVWMHAQRLDVREPFGSGDHAVRAAVEQLGYVQIDTINVVERCHHHILWSRIPAYERAHLHNAQAIDKNVFEYWTHALSYVPTQDFGFFVPHMKRQRNGEIPQWFGSVTEADVRRVLRLIRDDGALTIRDIKDDVLVEKVHLWASRKPSKAALQVAFYRGHVTVSERDGIVKTYELTARHFGWDKPPRAATERQVHAYLLDRALRAQGVVSIDSVCHNQRGETKAAIRALVDARVRRKQLVPVAVEGAGKTQHWAEPATLDAIPEPVDPLVHILSPFDPLIILRKRLSLFFGYDHLFEAYVPKAKRRFGYFALPVLVGDEVVAAIDLKADRDQGELQIQQWTWVGRGNERDHQRPIEAELERFERFQLAKT